MTEEDTARLTSQCARIELALCWLELDALLIDGVDVINRRPDSGVWRGYLRRVKGDHVRSISIIANNALRSAVRLASSAPGIYGPRAIQDAKNLVVVAIENNRSAVYA
jgi:hypothetical protein